MASQRMQRRKTRRLGPQAVLSDKMKIPKLGLGEKGGQKISFTL